MGNNVFTRKKNVQTLIKSCHFVLGGNRKLKIYGTLGCRSGKKMKIENRVFFSSPEQAVASGFRPCGHCMKQEYRTWKDKNKHLWI
jgi:methylphosphotriester-DNA--protein-cysteine methyltransferase